MAIEAISPDGRLVEFDERGNYKILSTVEVFTGGFHWLGYEQTTGRGDPIVIGESIFAYGPGRCGMVDGEIVVLGECKEGRSSILYNGK